MNEIFGFPTLAMTKKKMQISEREKCKISTLNFCSCSEDWWAEPQEENHHKPQKNIL